MLKSARFAADTHSHLIGAFVVQVAAQECDCPRRAPICQALHELYEKIHATEDRAERQKLKEHYKLHTQHLHDNQRHHGTMSDEEIARVEVQLSARLAFVHPSVFSTHKCQFFVKILRTIRSFARSSLPKRTFVNARYALLVSLRLDRDHPDVKQTFRIGMFKRCY